eukprot:TRINITY_DN10036_c0_g1_i1.p1 TRINITY_DN10036_c0_g1~~TRINITY_DN10036_c0_g1_i1.p1  ORF type:complete len:349 (+),score=83.01 TRINITY_DN10036_c0_g1_i1:83-1129(+)
MDIVDHLIVTVADLGKAIESFEALSGVRPHKGGRHIGFGTHNAITSLGDGIYLEFMAVDPEQDVDINKMYFGLKRYSLATPRLMAWCARSNGKLEEQIEHAKSLGFQLGEIISGGRTLPDGQQLSWKLTSPVKRPNQVAPFIIEWSSDSLPFHPSKTSPVGCQLVELRFEHPQASNIRDMLSKAYGASPDKLNVTEAETPLVTAVIQTPKGKIEISGNSFLSSSRFGKLSIQKAGEEDKKLVNSRLESLGYSTSDLSDEDFLLGFLNTQLVAIGRFRSAEDRSMDLFMDDVLTREEMNNFVKALLELPRGEKSVRCFTNKANKDVLISCGFKEQQAQQEGNFVTLQYD